MILQTLGNSFKIIVLEIIIIVMVNFKKKTFVTNTNLNTNITGKILNTNLQFTMFFEGGKLWNLVI